MIPDWALLVGALVLPAVVLIPIDIAIGGVIVPQSVARVFRRRR